MIEKLCENCDSHELLVDLKQAVFGDGKNGLQGRVLVMEQTIQNINDLQKHVRTAIFAVLGGVALLLIGFICSTMYSAMKQDATQDALRTMTLQIKKDLHPDAYVSD